MPVVWLELSRSEGLDSEDSGSGVELVSDGDAAGDDNEEKEDEDEEDDEDDMEMFN